MFVLSIFNLDSFRGETDNAVNFPGQYFSSFFTLVSKVNVPPNMGKLHVLVVARNRNVIANCCSGLIATLILVFCLQI